MQHINKSFEKGEFPSILKTSNIQPLFKRKGDKHDMNSFRPLYKTSNFSKIYQKLFNNRLINYLETFNLISKEQHGFRGGKSVNTACFQMLKFVNEQIDQNRYVLALYFDLSSAFDVVNNDILMTKLDKLGIRGNCNSWLMSLLKDREVRVQLKSTVECTSQGKETKKCKNENKIYSMTQNYFSDTEKQSLGIGQGSSLGPTLFNIFINDLPTYLKNQIRHDHMDIVIYADDITILISSGNLEEIKRIALEIINEFCNWCSTNQLINNISKTNYMFFSIKNKTHLYNDFKISINGQDLELTNSVRYLGLELDSQLKWTN